MKTSPKVQSQSDDFVTGRWCVVVNVLDDCFMGHAKTEMKFGDVHCCFRRLYGGILLETFYCIC